MSGVVDRDGPLASVAGLIFAGMVFRVFALRVVGRESLSSLRILPREPNVEPGKGANVEQTASFTQAP